MESRYMHKQVVFIALALAAASSSSIVLAEKSTGTATPIKHLVILYPENRSFDHYFGTYPRALNLPGERPFQPRPHTPAINGLTDDLLFGNPNAVNPIRLGPADIVECSQTHAYTSEQLSANLGAMDKFVENDGAKGTQAGGLLCDPNMVMGYFDGNTVTALWNYAQRYALSDNSFATTWGSSAVGALNLVSGQTHGASIDHDAKNADVIAGTVIGNPRPLLDDCSPATTNRITMSGKNIGDLLSQKGITWGWFNGGFRAATPGADKCTASHLGSNGVDTADYIPHHQPFQVLSVDRQPASRRAVLDRRDRHRRRRREPSVRSRPGLLGGRRVRAASGGELHQAAGVPGRTQPLFRFARGTGVPRHDDQPTAGAA